jgi:DNA-binding MarR family transcriptional regulator
MSNLSIAGFADRVSEIMPEIMREFMKRQKAGFYKLEVTMPQMIVLHFLDRHGESKMTEVADAMGVTTAAMTGAIERLVRDGYVSRLNDPNDRRIIKVKPTPKGTKIIKTFHQRKREMVMELFGKISQKEREDYLNILMHIRDHLK